MKNIIKKPFKPRGILMALCVILLCFSCKDDIFSGTPDKVIENISGTLRYHNEFKMWYVSYHFPETIDSTDRYLIIRSPYSKFSFKEKEGELVTISGYCYEVPQSDMEKRGMNYIVGGRTYYYIKITDLK